MTNSELLCAALSATRGTPIDHKTAAIGSGGLRPPDLQTIFTKWQMRNWTGFDPETAADTLASMARKGWMTERDGAYALTEEGTRMMRERIAHQLTFCKTIEDFHLALAFHKLVDEETVTAALRRYAQRLDESVNVNDWKVGQLKNTAFEDVMTVIAVQLRATKVWLDAKVAERAV